MPRVVSTAATRPAATVIPVTSTSRSIVTPSDCAVFANPIVTPLGSAMPSRWQKVAASTPSAFSPGARRGGLRRVEPLHVDAEAALQGDVALEGVDAGRGRQEEEVAVLMEIDRVADFVGEALEQADRLDRQLDVRLVRELMPDAAGVPAGGSCPEHRLALEQHDVGDAEPGEVIGDARAHTTAADDDDFSRSFHPWYSYHEDGRSTKARHPEPGNLEPNRTENQNQERTLNLNPEPRTRQDPLTFSTCSMTRRMFPPRIFSTSASE